ncbi:MAG: hypothetical protein IJU21_03665, partial [Bacteroidales bacterium]|nr:hypothetical protein [Bacteroidales bacterium]
VRQRVGLQQQGLRNGKGYYEVILPCVLRGGPFRVADFFCPLCCNADAVELNRLCINTLQDSLGFNLFPNNPATRCESSS